MIIYFAVSHILYFGVKYWKEKVKPKSRSHTEGIFITTGTETSSNFHITTLMVTDIEFPQVSRLVLGLFSSSLHGATIISPVCVCSAVLSSISAQSMKHWCLVLLPGNEERCTKLISNKDWIFQRARGQRSRGLTTSDNSSQTTSQCKLFDHIKGTEQPTCRAFKP